MNYTVVILAIILVVIIFYMVFSDWFSTSKLVKQASLKNSIPDILAKDLVKPTSTRYAYSIWIYVNSWDTATSKPIFGRNGDIELALDATIGKFTCKLGPNVGDTSKDPSTITVTNNFPLQKWVFVTVSIDNTIADIYLDGKLVKSVQIAQVSPNDSSNVIFGKGYDIYIADLKRYTEVQDPQSVWNTYMKGNGGSVVNKVGSSYAVNLSILKDDVEWNKFNLW
jgi:hypothetical protein